MPSIDSNKQRLDGLKQYAVTLKNKLKARENALLGLDEEQPELLTAKDRHFWYALNQLIPSINQATFDKALKEHEKKLMNRESYKDKALLAACLLLQYLTRSNHLLGQQRLSHEKRESLRAKHASACDAFKSVTASEFDEDAVRMQVGTFIRTCKANQASQSELCLIEKLQTITSPLRIRVLKTRLQSRKNALGNQAQPLSTTESSFERALSELLLSIHDRRTFLKKINTHKKTLTNRVNPEDKALSIACLLMQYLAHTTMLLEREGFASIHQKSGKVDFSKASNERQRKLLRRYEAGLDAYDSVLAQESYDNHMRKNIETFSRTCEANQPTFFEKRLLEQLKELISKLLIFGFFTRKEEQTIRADLKDTAFRIKNT